jgi:hypothetical protein
MDMHCHHVYTPIVVMLPAHVCLGLTFLNVLIFALTFFNVNNMCLSLTNDLLISFTRSTSVVYIWFNFNVAKLIKKIVKNFIFNICSEIDFWP